MKASHKTRSILRRPQAKSKLGKIQRTTRDVALENAGQLALYQMEQCERMFRDDTQFMEALNSLRAAFDIKPGLTVNPTPAKVWVLTMDIQNSGISTEVFSSKEAAQTSLYSHATEYWAQEMGSEPLPTDRNEVIESYFGREDADDSYILTECEVED